MVQPDGTVSTKAISSIQNLAIGPAATGLAIAAIDSIASITIPPGKKPITELQITMIGVTLGGVPVTIDSRGIRISDQVAAPPDALAAFKAGMDSLAAQGLILEPGPRDETVTADGAKTLRRRVLLPLPLPRRVPAAERHRNRRDLRSSAAVAAEATARQRTAPPPTAAVADTPVDSPATPVTDENLPTAAEPGLVPDVGAPAVGLPGTSPAAGAPPVAGSAEPEVVFALPTRVADPLPGQSRDSYRFVMLAAVAGIGAVIVLRKRIV